MITRRMLNRLGCANIDIAENGNQVLRKTDETAYDMILMDVCRNWTALRRRGRSARG